MFQHDARSSLVAKASVVLVFLLVYTRPASGQANLSYEPRPAQITGPELLAVVVSAGYCTDSDRADYRSSIERMKLILRDTAKTRGLSFAVAGVAVDWSVEDGVYHLSRLGKFDQVIVGAGWTNLMSSRIANLAPKGELITPQVMVFERVVRESNGRILVISERLLHAVIGVDQIVQWVNGGAVVPRSRR